MRMLKNIAMGFAIAFASLSIAVPGSAEAATEPKPTDKVELDFYQDPELVPVPATRTETEKMICVAAGLKADVRTEAQARDLKGTDLVTIDGVKSALGDDQSYYTRCQGATAEERLAATTVNFERTTEYFKAANGTLKLAQPWIYVDPAGPSTRANTYQYQYVMAINRLETAAAWSTAKDLGLIVLVLALIASLFRYQILNLINRNRRIVSAS